MAKFKFFVQRSFSSFEDAAVTVRAKSHGEALDKLEAKINSGGVRWRVDWAGYSPDEYEVYAEEED